MSIFLSRWAANAFFWLLMGGTPVEGPFHKKCEGLLPPGSAIVQRRTNSRRESRALQFLRISKEMLENLVNIDMKKIIVLFSS